MDVREIEREIARRAGVEVAVRELDGEVVVTGMAQTDGEREAALDVARELAEAGKVVDDIVVASAVPERIQDLDLADASAGDFPEVAPGTSDREALEPGDFSDQEILENAEGAAGPGYTAADEEFSEGEEAYVPPTDPVRTREGEFLGGFSTTSMDDVGPVGGDEALRDAILTELREDSATTALDLDVQVESGVVRVRGRVADALDVEGVLSVLDRVPGIRDVIDEMEVPGE